MSSDPGARTSASLLGRLCAPGDDAAWRTFMDRYQRQILGWCRAWGLQDADAEDVTATVLANLAARLRGFRYDPARSFRAYLKTLTRYAWCDFVEGQRRPGGGTGDTEAHIQLRSVQARDDLEQKLLDEFNAEVLEQAFARVRERVEEHTWEAFRLTALDGLSGAEAASRLDMKVATVFKAKSKVQKMLQEEVQRLEEE
jgi:RNA polymerase sigma-70 factor (ECF subfamily)